ncbi:MAG: PH domain-containing protein [Actinomycetia bacterium]|nr:PH domain-containing protein [Actinomycetes bacterium]MCP4960279.1 PH domain-containing protein [Actinomycetes bacterium]
MTPDSELLSAVHRQSLWAPVFIVIGALRRLGFAQLAIIAVVVGTGRLPGPEIIIIPIVIVLLAGWSVLSWHRFTFSLENENLVVERGVVSLERVLVPLQRIQSVNIEQQLLHRPVALVQVTIDTAGSDNKAEVVIAATSRTIAEAIQRMAGSTHASVGPETVDSVAEQPIPRVPSAVLATRSPSDLVKIALTNRPLAGLILIAPLAGLADDLFDALGISVNRSDANSLVAFDSLILAIGVIVVATIGIVVALQVVWTFITEFGLTVSRDGEVLRRESGLLDRKSASSAISRIQQIEIDQTPLQRLVSHRTIRLPTAGDQSSLRLPGASEGELQTIRDLTVEPDAQVGALQRRIDRSAAFYWFRIPALGLILGSLVTGFLVHGAAFTLLLLLVPLWFYFDIFRRRWGWGVTDLGLATRSGVLSTRRIEAALRRAQRVSVTQNLFQRRNGTATVTMQTAEGAIKIPFLALTEAEGLRDRVLYATAVDLRPWF